MNRVFKATVVENKKLINNHYLLTLHPAVKIKKPRPGNFFMVAVETGLDPLLKRPFSIHRWIDGNFQLLYRVTGKGTKILSEKKPGNILDILGPLGKGFPFPGKDRQVILVAGGIGIAPMYAMAESIKDKNPLLFYGTKTKKDVLLVDDFRSMGVDLRISTDDGSYGVKGNIVNVLKKYIARDSLKAPYVMYACGPAIMLMKLSGLASEYKMKGYIAMEQNMACGIGTCLGCVVKTRKGHKRVCKEGPVFPIEEIIW
ncbi:MAG: dihydroorotate dehydrogenase electron transfer subunit [Nitrospiraceae bacterium]|nr:MAG: dihydroorotate dehydrogenase electron transfer subunit [Nitrospiraceae bacterium]